MHALRIALSPFPTLSIVVLPGANCGCAAGANGVVFVTDRKFVRINCKQVDANKVSPGHVVVAIELEVLRLLEPIAHCCGCARV